MQSGRCATTAARAFRAGHYQAEIDHLGVARSRAHHYEPQADGCVARFLQTLNEQVLWIERFDTLDSSAPASTSSRATSTSAGCSNATATAPAPGPRALRQTATA